MPFPIGAIIAAAADDVIADVADVSFETDVGVDGSMDDAKCVAFDMPDIMDDIMPCPEDLVDDGRAACVVFAALLLALSGLRFCVLPLLEVFFPMNMEGEAF